MLAAKLFKPLVSALTAVESAMRENCSVIALLTRATEPRSVSLVPSRSLSAFVSAGMKVRADSDPDSTSLNSSSVVTPRPLAASAVAPGSASPSCWRNSSRLTVPLDAICPTASSACSAFALLRPSRPETRVNSPNRALESPSGMFAAWVAAENLVKAALKSSTFRPDVLAATFSVSI